VINDNLLKISVNNLVKVYSNDLYEVYDKLKQFIAVIKVWQNKKLIRNLINKLKMIIEDNLSVIFPHIYVAFQLCFFNISVTN